jgi:pyruvate-ferredoxin/flavodoxin oxidoreductase
MKLAGNLGDDLVTDIIKADQTNEAGIFEQRQRIKILKEKLQQIRNEDAETLYGIADYLVKKSVWIIGGDGWAYDIGFGGLDHVLSSGKNVNILILDTEVYSNTGGQMSKSTGLGAVAKFAAAGKSTPKKDLGMIAMNYGNVYVANVAMGANDTQTLRALLEAESYNGPSLIIAYSHCIAHGINMSKALDNQKAAVDSAYWILYRYDPRNIEKGINPLKLDSGAAKIKFKDYAYKENRYKMLKMTMPEHAAELMKKAQESVDDKWKRYEAMSQKLNSENS